MLISVHLPKTAGLSFARSLTEYFGESLLKDYADLPLHQTTLKRNKHAITQSLLNYYRELGDINCIHGHFLPLKYRFHNTNHTFKYVTWMREPAERLASQYYYMIRHYTPEKASTQPLLRRMIDEKWTLERFCLGPELRNTYAKFLWGFPIKQFDFIGIVENYEDELNFFSSNILQNDALSHYQQNANPITPSASYFSENIALKNQVLNYHSRDVDIYQHALRLAYQQNRLVNYMNNPEQ